MFSNTSGTERCVTVQATVESPAFAKLAAYAPTFDPANLSQNFLGHIASGFTDGSDAFSFIVPSGSTFVVVVFESASNAGVSNYELTLSSASATPPCSRTGSTLTVTVESGESTTIGRSGSEFDVTGPKISDPTCGGATVNNVDSIVVTGDGGGQQVSMDLSGGAIGPGATAEGSGASEIETCSFEVS